MFTLSKILSGKFTPLFGNLHPSGVLLFFGKKYYHKQDLPPVEILMELPKVVYLV